MSRYFHSYLPTVFELARDGVHLERVRCWLALGHAKLDAPDCSGRRRHEAPTQGSTIAPP